jgi:hypothetical protein
VHFRSKILVVSACALYDLHRFAVNAFIIIIRAMPGSVGKIVSPSYSIVHTPE